MDSPGICMDRRLFPQIHLAVVSPYQVSHHYSDKGQYYLLGSYSVILWNCLRKYCSYNNASNQNFVFSLAKWLTYASDKPLIFQLFPRQRIACWFCFVMSCNFFRFLFMQRLLDFANVTEIRKEERKVIFVLLQEREKLRKVTTVDADIKILISSHESFYQYLQNKEWNIRGEKYARIFQKLIHIKIVKLIMNIKYKKGSPLA